MVPIMSDAPDQTRLIQQGQAAAREGQMDKAREILRRAIQLDPDDVRAWLVLAGVEREPEAKMDCYERVLALDPSQAEARLALDLLQRKAAAPRPARRHPPSRQDATGSEPEEDLQLDAVIAEASRRLAEAVGPPPSDEVPADDKPPEILFCANHPNVETRLRCNRCAKPICIRCAVRTPVGYRCRQCVGRQRAAYYTGGPLDYVIGGLVALVLGAPASYLIGLLGAWFFSLILGPTIGMAIAEVVRLAVRRRRSQYLWVAVGSALVVSALPVLFLGLASLRIWSLLSLALFLVLSVGAAVARLR